jgi:hypothetical protein
MAKARNFRDDWIQKFGTWLEKRDSQAWCKLCSVPLAVTNGVAAINQHVKTAKHKSKVGKGTQAAMESFFVKKEAQSEDVWSVKDLSVKAEIVTALWFCAGNTSFLNADGLVPWFQCIFPDSAIAQNMTLGPNKMSYLISDGLGPYFAAQTVGEIKRSKAYFTLHFDETMNAQVKKQMDVLVRFWCEGKGEVQVRYLSSIMFGHAKAVDVVAELMALLDRHSIPLEQLLSLGMDGPNVNKSIQAKIDKVKRENGLPPLVMCPKSCLLHTCHNSFVKGMKEFGLESENLANQIFYFFKRSPTRRHDLLDIQEALGLDENMAIRHLPSRWLTLVPALERIIKMKGSLVGVFKELLKTDKDVAQDKESKVQVMLISLQSRKLELQMEFLVSVKPLFDEFLTRFQMEEPMIHKLYPACAKLLKVAMSRMLRSDVYNSVEGRNLLNIDVDDVTLYLEDKDFVTVQGKRVQEALGRLTDGHRGPILGMRSFYKAAIKALQKNLPLDSDLLSALTCFDPQNQKSLGSLVHCKVVAQAMPCITEADDRSIGDEWVKFQQVDIPEKDRNMRVDHFWQQIFEKGDACQDAFQVLPKLVKSALSLCHSNADVERSLSVNKRVLTKERTGLRTETLIGIRHSKSAIARYGDVTKVPVTRDLLQAAQRAWGVYAAKLREEKDKKMLKEKQAAAKEEKKAKKRHAKERYNDLMKELEGLNEEGDKVKEQLDRTMQSIREETAKITGAKGDVIQIAAAAHQLEFWNKQQTELSAKIAEIGKKRKEKEEEKDALAKKSKL